MNRMMKIWICIFAILAMIIMNIPNNSFLYLDNDIIQYKFNQNSTRIATDPATFVSIWNTNILSGGSSASNQVWLPLITEGTYDFTVNWGDGINSTIQSWNQPEVIHTYSTAGVYTLLINGTIIGWQFNDQGDKLKIIEIQQWGCLGLGNSGYYFAGCINLRLTASDNLNLLGTTNLRCSFYGCANLGSSGNLNEWDVSQVTNMLGLFWGASTFNQPLENWNVSKVQDIRGTFQNALDFNQSLETWKTSSAMYMTGMFWGASTFNQPLGSWNVSKVRDMSVMFCNASSFNQPLENWDVSNVRDMSLMFCNASSFNQPLENWDVSNVRDMSEMFAYASVFNQPLENWNISNVYSIVSMFCNASSFNQPLGSWDVSNNYYLNGVFYNTSSFDQPLGTWNVSKVLNMENIFAGVTLSTANYDQLILGWSQLPLQNGVIFDAGNSKYSEGAASTARQYIINTYQWEIRDAGKAPATTTTSSTSSTTTTTTSTEPETSSTPTNPFAQISGYPFILLIGLIGILGFIFQIKVWKKIKHISK